MNIVCSFRNIRNPRAQSRLHWQLPASCAQYSRNAGQTNYICSLLGPTLDYVTRRGETSRSTRFASYARRLCPVPGAAGRIVQGARTAVAERNHGVVSCCVGRSNEEPREVLRL